MQAHVLSLNDFNMARVYEEPDSAYVHIVYLLLLEPGTFPMHPKMGVGLRSRYRHNNDDNFLYSLENDITNQMQKYLPEISTVSVSVSAREDDHVLGIVIDTTTGTYTVSYDSDQDVINAAATSVLDDL